jgi:hypothetical protein
MAHGVIGHLPETEFETLLRTLLDPVGPHPQRGGQVDALAPGIEEDNRPS